MSRLFNSDKRQPAFIAGFPLDRRSCFFKNVEKLIATAQHFEYEQEESLRNEVLTILQNYISEELKRIEDVPQQDS